MATAPETSLVDRLEDNLQCQIHMGTLENPKTLPCNHVFCKSCLDRWIAQKNGRLICIYCNIDHGSFPDGAGALPNTFHLIPLLEVLNQATARASPVDQSCVGEKHRIVSFCITCSKSVCHSCKSKNHKSHVIQDIKPIKQELSHKKKNINTALQRAKTSRGQLKENSHLAKEKLDVFRAECIDRVNDICDKAVEEINAVVDNKLSTLSKQMSDFSELYDRYKDAEEILKALSTTVPVSLQDNPKEMWERFMVIKCLSNTTTSIENPYLKFEVNDPSDMQLTSAGKLTLKTSPDAYFSTIEVVKSSDSASVRIKVHLQDSQKKPVSYAKEDIILRVVQPNKSNGYVQNDEDSYTFIPTMIGDHSIQAFLYGRELNNSPYDLRVSLKFKQKALKFSDIKYKGAHDLVEFNNEIYVTDKDNNRIVVTDKNGKMRRNFTFSSTNKIHPFEPFGLAISPAGIVYITDCANHEVIMCDIYGRLIIKFGKQKLKKPTGIALKDNGDILVVDYDEHCLCIFNPNGRFKTSYGNHGTECTNFKRPWFVSVQNSGIIVVTDADNSRLQFLLSKEKTKSIDVTHYGKPASVRGITIDCNNNIFISVGVQALTYGAYYDILIYTSTGEFLGCLSRSNILVRPRGMCITKLTSGKQVLLVADETFGIAYFEFNLQIHN